MKRLIATAAAVIILAALLLQAQPTHAASNPSMNTDGGWNHERLTWYGPGYYGHTMACGGTLTKKTIAVAARGLPCGTLVEIRVKRHGQVVHDRTVTVLDYCPGCTSWHLDATARLMIHLTGHPPHSLNAKHVQWRVVAWQVW